MKSMREEALEYVSPETRNVADLDSVDVSLEIKEKTALDSKGEEFKYKYVEVEGEEYRVPVSVLKQLKTLLEEKPDIQRVKVKKTGEGLNTAYMVIAK